MKKRVTLTFPRTIVPIPITYLLAKDFNVAANIIRAQIAPDKVGKLAVELQGDIDAIDAALEWMTSHGIDVSSVNSEISIDENLCVDCGLCTGVCPTNALTLDPKSFRLKFMRSRCVVCEQCVSNCPVDAISTNI